MIAVYIILGLMILYALITYNLFVKKLNNVKRAKSGIDVYLTQRFELIPNLVECVKGYCNYEEEVFQNIAKLRESYFNNKNLKEAEMLDKSFAQLIAVSEGNPELKASEQFLNLQHNLSKIESQLQAARRIYNMDVTSYNNLISIFPSNIFAKLFRFKEVELFEAEIQTKENINMEI